MSRITDVLLTGLPLDDGELREVIAILGGELNTSPEIEPGRFDVFQSRRDFGHGVWLSSLNYASVQGLLRELGKVRWRYPELVVLMIRPEDASQWAVYRIDPPTGGWEMVVPPMVWHGVGWNVLHGFPEALE